jgi:hypothetical protein
LRSRLRSRSRHRAGRPDFYDLSIGGIVWRDTVIAFANVLVPLNDDGRRDPAVGLEAAF